MTKENILTFEEEISYLGGKPVLVAIGRDAYRILNEHLGYKYTIIKITHYSSRGLSKEDYRQEVLEKLDSVETDLSDTSFCQVRVKDLYPDSRLIEFLYSKKEILHNTGWTDKDRRTKTKYSDIK